MVPITQTKVVVKNSAGEMVVRGNCYAACIASLLEMQITDVPNVEVLFEMPDDYWIDTIVKWLNSINYDLCTSHKFQVFHDENYGNVEMKRDDWINEMKDKYYMVSGDSPRGVKHMVIYQNGVMVHDPYPTREGIVTLDHFNYIEKIEAF